VHSGEVPGHGLPGVNASKFKRLRPKLRYKLFGCGIHGHELVGTDARRVEAADGLTIREFDGLRWYRCLRCDGLPLPPPVDPDRDRPAGRDQTDVPLRGKPLPDRFVLRLIALDRVVHVLVLGSIAVAVVLFASNRGALHHDYLRVLDDLQGGVGGPMFDTRRGIFPEINRLFALSTVKLYFVGLGVAAYALLLAIEAVGLWRARRWAEYLTFVETGVLVPFEIYELTSGVSALKVLTLVINLAIVLYLLISKRHSARNLKDPWCRSAEEKTMSTSE
jgi:uncharacterized membrane protein (DUF2068 family)